MALETFATNGVQVSMHALDAGHRLQNWCGPLPKGVLPAASFFIAS
jgi:hypothetical protein